MVAVAALKTHVSRRLAETHGYLRVGKESLYVTRAHQ